MRTTPLHIPAFLVAMGLVTLGACSSDKLVGIDRDASVAAPQSGGATSGAAAGGADALTGGAPATSTAAAATGGASSASTATAAGGTIAIATGDGTTALTGGVTATGGNLTNPSGGAATGGSPVTATGGVIATGGTPTTPIGGAATGGTVATPVGGADTGGSKATGGGVTNTTGGQSVGGSSTIEGPCDIYAVASPATPCVAAYSPTRILYGKYQGPLYRLRKNGTWTSLTGATGGTTQDINAIDGYPDTATHDSFCAGATCTFETIYDQSGKGNHLKVAPKGCYTGTAAAPDTEASATAHSTTLNGHKAYAIYTVPHDGYRNNATSGVPVGNVEQGIYEVVDGTRVGDACCFDFGNVSTDNCNGGTSNALFFGTAYWGKGDGTGPWFLADFNQGAWSGGNGASNTTNTSNPSMGIAFAFGILKTGPLNYAIRAANATSGGLTTAYDGGLPKTLTNPGGVVLGTYGDNSNSSFGTFFEGVITAGRPTDATDALVLANVQAAGYGK